MSIEQFNTTDDTYPEQVTVQQEALVGLEEEVTGVPEKTQPIYIAITIAHNEEKFIEKNIKSVLSQKPQPTLYVVVDDGSNDKTSSIIERYPVLHIKIEEPRLFLGSMNMHRALVIGIKKATELVPDWEFLLKVDADSIIPRDYFHRLYNQMEKYPNLGICSGVMRGGKIWEGRASDGAKLYRRDCWDDIGGLDQIVHWDTHAILKAYHKGWNVTAFIDIEYEETRTSEKEKLYEWYITGLTRFMLGFPFYHTICVGAIYLKKKPYIIGSFIMILTHLIQIIRRRPLPFSKSYYEFIKGFFYIETLKKSNIILKELGNFLNNHIRVGNK
ncbi:MAG: glycosyltransferase family 2 protein [Deltaproteobacteria bacterium]|nr:glycosyltransferase family 2 protein [Deltaproteobacteria bacterium]